MDNERYFIAAQDAWVANSGGAFADWAVIDWIVTAVEPLICADERERIAEYAHPWWDGNCCEPVKSGEGIVSTCCQNARDRIIESRARAEGGLTRAMQEAVAARLVEAICEMQAELDNYGGAPAWYCR